MKTKQLHYFLFLSLLTLSACQENNSQNNTAEETPEVYKDVLTASPEHTKVLLENEYVRLLEINLPPGVEQPLHQGKKRLIYSLTDYTISWTEQGEDEGEKSWSEGDAHWHEAGVHAATNTGENPARFLVAERKDNALPACDANTDDLPTAEAAAGQTVRSIFENEQAIVKKITLAPDASIPQHQGLPRVIYSLNDYTLSFKDVHQEAPMEQSFAAGDVHWHDPCPHQVINTGDETAEFLVLAFRE